MGKQSLGSGQFRVDVLLGEIVILLHVRTVAHSTVPYSHSLRATQDQIFGCLDSKASESDLKDS